MKGSEFGSAPGVGGNEKLGNADENSEKDFVDLLDTEYAIAGVFQKVERLVEPEAVTNWRLNLTPEQNASLDSIIQSIKNSESAAGLRLAEEVICTSNNIASKLILYPYSGEYILSLSSDKIRSMVTVLIETYYKGKKDKEGIIKKVMEFINGVVLAKYHKKS